MKEKNNMGVTQIRECPICKHTWYKDPNDTTWGEWQGTCSKCGYPSTHITHKEFYQSICLCIGCKTCEYHNNCDHENN